MSTTQIQIYATDFKSTAEHLTHNITLDGIDADQILNEFTIDERLESIDLGDIADYLTKKQNEELEYINDSILRETAEV